VTAAVLLGVCTDVKTSGAAPVLVGSQIVSAQCPRDLTVAAGDTVTLVKAGSSFYVLARYYTAAGGSTDPGASPVPPSAPVVRTGTTTFLPRRTASWGDRFGWRHDNDDIYHGEYGGNGNYTGCAFYGFQLQTLSGATVLSATMKARRLHGGVFAAQATNLGHVTEAFKPDGEPTFGGTFTGPDLAVGQTRTGITVSVSLVQSLVDGTYHSLGIHVDGGSPYVVLAGSAEYGGAFALTVRWRKTS
jgi:hypothetical protein